MAFAVGKNHGSSTGQPHGTFTGQGHGSLPVQNPKNTSGAALPALTENQLIKEVQAIILPFPIKEMAEIQGCTPRAVESQRSGDSCMSFRAAINAGRANVRVRAHILRLLGVEGAVTDPDFMEGAAKIAEFYLQQGLPSNPFRQPQPADQPQDFAGERDDLTGDLFEHCAGSA